MKKILFIFMTLICSVVFAQKAFEPIVHTIQQPLMLQPVQHRSPSLLMTYKPKRYPFKFTIKPGINQSAASQYMQTSGSDLIDALDNASITGLTKYDMRLKFYVYKRSGIVLRMLIQDPGPAYTIGWITKF